MDVSTLVDCLRATLEINLREEAEKKLTEVHKIIGFTPHLMQVVMSDQIDMPVRQAGVIYLKNMVTQFWLEKEVENPAEPVPFSIHEQDRVPIRENIVHAVIQVPDAIRVQLCVCVSHIIKCDYPGRWPDAPEKMAAYVQSDAHQTWMGALMCIYQLVKVYEYKRNEERAVMDTAMKGILPLLFQRITQMMPDPSDISVLMQKQILKIFYAFVQNHLPMDVVTREVFTQWMEVVRQIVERDVPPEINQVDEEERPDLPWWKVKKWAVHILARVFERYGTPGGTTKEYTAFAEWYLKTFSGGILQALFKTMEQYRLKQYVTPRVMQQTLNYINHGVNHALSWKFIKNSMQSLIQDVIFPLMCHNDEDDDLWHSDPLEFIRVKYDVFEDFLSPVMAAQTLFHTATAKRKEVLNKAMEFCMTVLNNPNAEPRQRDGALHMIGAVAEVLLKRKVYKDQAERMLTEHVFKEFKSEHGFLRARACWVLRYFCELKFKGDGNLVTAMTAIKACLLGDQDLPVRVEAALAVQMLVTEQEKARQFLQPHVSEIIFELLAVIRKTENDDLTGVMQRLVVAYVDEITPLAVAMTSHLADTFAQVIESDVEGSEEKSITALGILNTIETVLNVMEDSKEVHGKNQIILQLEGIVLRVIGIILQQNIMDFYEEVLTLTYSLTTGQVSNHMWEVFPMIYQMFKKDGIDFFTDMMPALHNYVTVDTDAFLSKPQCVEAVYDMCKCILAGEVGEDAEVHAAKLMEVIILQCPGKVDGMVPLLVQAVLGRLTRPVQTSELRTMCLQVVIAALYTRPQLLLDTLGSMAVPGSQGPILQEFLSQWIRDADCFLGLHDRKLSVLGLCSLLSMTSARPQEVTNVAHEILPAMLILFQGLKRAYASRAEAENSDDDEDDDDDNDDGVNELCYRFKQIPRTIHQEELEDMSLLDDEEDDIDEEGVEYLEKLAAKADFSLKFNAGNDDDDSDEYSDDGAEETQLESYNTPLDDERCMVDEYVAFKEILSNLSAADSAWYTALTQGLTQQQQQQVEEVFELAERRKAASESKKIEQGGGYNFTQRTVPSNFNFGN